MPRYLIAIVLPTASGLLACAPAPAGSTAAREALGTEARPCFSVQRVLNYRSPDGLVIYVRSRDQDVFELRAAGYCDGVQTGFQMALQSDYGSDRLCVGDGARLITGSNTSTGPCRVRVEKRLTTVEVEALPGSAKP